MGGGNFKIPNRKVRLFIYTWKGLFETKTLIKVVLHATIIKGIIGCNRKHTLPPLSWTWVKILENCKKCSINLIGRDSGEFWFKKKNEVGDIKGKSSIPKSHR